MPYIVSGSYINTIYSAFGDENLVFAVHSIDVIRLCFNCITKAFNLSIVILMKSKFFLHIHVICSKNLRSLVIPSLIASSEAA
jgi:hypothetical protein